jgi:tRNA(Ile)-lysidine synthase
MSEAFDPDLFRKRLQRFVEREKLFHARQPLLLAISGGLDSVVLSHVLHELGYQIVLGHVNFGLRGEESNADESFVVEWAQQLGCPVHTVRFDTENHRKEHRMSIQASARALRYEWLETLRTRLSGSDPSRRFRLITAHHEDDNIETMLLHFFRGTGISGMRGMLPGTVNVARPLLFARREELVSYAQACQLNWREDRSNAEDKYDRNFLRLRVLPMLAERFPSIRNNLAANLHRFREIEQASNKTMKPILRKLVKTDSSGLMRIPVQGLLLTGFAESLLWELLKGVGFSAAQVAEAMHLTELPSGRWVASETHRVVRHRNWLLIHPLKDETTPIAILDEASGSLQFQEGSLIWESDKYSGEEIPKESDTVWLDLKDIRFPIILRKWSKGDYFYPLGMDKKKKVARFLIDSKISLPEKDKIWLLESDSRVLWVVGKRMDGRFQIKPSTRSILKITFLRH